ncbi:MAG: hypothetical protein ACPGNV_17180 [Mangrovicoccus sp.]
MASLIAGLRTQDAPAAQNLALSLLLAEADSSVSNGDLLGDLLAARATALIRLGALPQAEQLLIRAGAQHLPQIFDLWLNAALLLGTEDKPCRHLAEQSSLSSDLVLRSFCLGRAGRWSTAELTYQTGVALGAISGLEAQLLAEFLDPDLAEENAQDLARRSMPTPPSPIVFRIFEALGRPLETLHLPLAYAWSDLRPEIGWQAQIRAAERLSRRAVLDPNFSLGLFTAEPPAASGGAWDRLRALQDLESAIRTGGDASQPLIIAAARYKSAGLEPAFARMIYSQIQDLTLSPKAQNTALRLAILAGELPDAPAESAPIELRLAHALAADTTLPEDLKGSFHQALARSFTASAPAVQSRIGESLLASLTLLAPDSVADFEDISGALSLMRSAGQDSRARWIAAQLALLRPAQ